MSQLYIIYKNKTAGVYLEGNPWLKRYINMDMGKISFTTGTRVGGRPINPKGKLGKELIRTAEQYISDPNTKWYDKAVWHGFFHDKYPPFNTTGRLMELPKVSSNRGVWVFLSVITFLTILILLATVS